MYCDVFGYDESNKLYNWGGGSSHFAPSIYSKLINVLACTWVNFFVYGTLLSVAPPKPLLLNSPKNTVLHTTNNLGVIYNFLILHGEVSSIVFN